MLIRDKRRSLMYIYDVIDDGFISKFSELLIQIGLEKQLPYIDSMIECEADKFQQYEYICKEHKIPLDEGLMIYLISKCYPFADIARNKMPIEIFLIEYHKKIFKRGIKMDDNSLYN